MSWLRNLALKACLLAMTALAPPAPAFAQSPSASAKAATDRPAIQRSTPPTAELEAYVDGIVRDSLIQDHIVGATVAIVQDGRVLLKKGYGAASLSPWRPVDPDRTLFRLVQSRRRSPGLRCSRKRRRDDFAWTHPSTSSCRRPCRSATRVSPSR